jgi:hypothetical protein
MNPRPLNVGQIHAATDVTVTMHQPGPAGAIVVHAGRLLSAVLRDGRLHHYRISVGGGVALLAPPRWLTRDSRAAVIVAGLPVPAPEPAVVRGPAWLAPLRSARTAPAEMAP